MLVYYRRNDTTVRVAPDVFAFGAVGEHPRHSWLIWRESKGPDFVMEVASRGTYQRYLVEKRDIYRRIGVTEYWRYDPTGRILRPRLIGESLVNGADQPIAVVEDAAGVWRGYSSLPGLDSCVLDQMEPRLYDPLTREWLPTRREIVDARRAAEAALSDAEAENRRLREQLRRLQSQ